ncbi:MAG: hypothetical protein OHK0048_06990 [Rhodoferax sp.]
MASLSSIPVSGMRAAQAQLRSSAHNVANLQTANFRREEVLQAELPQGGVVARVRTADQAGPDLQADVVNQLEAKNAFAANLQVFKRQSEALGRLLDDKA